MTGKSSVLKNLLKESALGELSERLCREDAPVLQAIKTDTRKSGCPECFFIAWRTGERDVRL